LFDILAARELAHKKIDEFCEDFISKLNNFEIESLAICQNSAINDLEARESLNGHNQFLNEWTAYLNSPKMKESEVESLKSEAQQHLKSLKRKAIDLNYKCFGAKKLKFEENSQMTSDFLGILQVQNIFFSDQLENPRQLNIIEIFNGESVQIERDVDENFALCFHNLKNETLSLVVVDTDGNIKWKQENILLENQMSSILNYKLFKINGDYFVYVSYLKTSKINCEIYSFNKYLVFLKKIIYHRPIKALAIFENKIYSLWSKNNQACLSLSIMDDKFENSKSIGQSNPTQAFYFAKSIAQIEVNEEYYFLLDKKQVYLMDKKSGTISRKINIDSFQFTLFRDKFIVTFKSKEKKLTSYDFHGEMISDEKGLFTTSTKLIKSLNESLIFFDHKQSLLSF
jgi:hypothetical protein